VYGGVVVEEASREGGGQGHGFEFGDRVAARHYFGWRGPFAKNIFSIF
jgi:hypothetical protein